MIASVALQGKNRSLAERLAEHQVSGPYPLHMPGHKRNTDLCKMGNPYGLDITEIEGFDDLHAPEGILKEGMERAARLYGAGRSWYLVNGSTAGILAGITALAKPGSTVLTARNCHRSVFHALLINRLDWMSLMPEMLTGNGRNVGDRWGIAGEIRAEVVEKSLKQHKNISLVVITSPTYEGVISDIPAIAKACHACGVPLMVDEAHGAHLGFGGFPGGALAGGADLVVQSLHKTLPAFTQTGLLHIQGNLADPEKVKQALDIFQTSSPSYILMAGIDTCLRKMEEDTGFIRTWREMLEGFYEETGDLQNLRVLPPEEGCLCEKNPVRTGETERMWRRDPSKLVILTAGTGHSGPELVSLLREGYGFEPEMAAADYVIAMTGAGDRPEALRRFAEALKEIDRAWGEEKKKRAGDRLEKTPEELTAGQTGELPEVYAPGMQKESLRGKICPEQVYSLWEAQQLPWEVISLDETAVGRISLDFALPYPPGIPLLVPGERITRESLKLLDQARRAGIPLRGLADQTGKTIRVSTEEETVYEKDPEMAAGNRHHRYDQRDQLLEQP